MLQPTEFITQTVYESLLEEVTTTPKPGLVDLNNNGSHHDLNLELFRLSAEALKSTFHEIASLSLAWNDPLDSLFSAIRTVGKQGELRMFEATGGVNTHKGALFSLGILSGASAYAIGHGLPLDPASLCQLVSRMTKQTLEQELFILCQKDPTSHGEMLFRTRGHRGIRGEVMEGFPSIVAYILPYFPQFSLPLGMDNKITILLTLMANVEDTNILSRGGSQALDYVQGEAHKLLLDQQKLTGREFNTRLIAADDAFIARNLSGGGAADLLAVSIYLYRFSTDRALLQFPWAEGPNAG